VKLTIKERAIKSKKNIFIVEALKLNIESFPPPCIIREQQNDPPTLAKY
jgi:hypothetical protein